MTLITILDLIQGCKTDPELYGTKNRAPLHPVASLEGYEAWGDKTSKANTKGQSGPNLNS